MTSLLTVKHTAHLSDKYGVLAYITMPISLLDSRYRRAFTYTMTTSTYRPFFTVRVSADEKKDRSAS